MYCYLHMKVPKSRYEIVVISHSLTVCVAPCGTWFIYNSNTLLFLSNSPFG